MDNTKFSQKRRTFITSSASAILLPSAVFATADDYGIRGKLAPELEISQWIDGDGKATRFKLAEHKGKFVFMEFWQFWCPGCHSHGFPGLKKISDALKHSKHFTAVAIQTAFEGYSSNTADKMRQIQKQYDLNLVMGHDAGDTESHGQPKTMIDYRSGGTPWAILISPEGKVLFNDFQINPEGAIALLKGKIGKMA
jgi:thiol-disulfide isomerase/thioredoxin